jgi:hypothetical protein
MNPASSHTPRHLLAAGLAGVLSYLACRLPAPFGGLGTNWGPGLIFGVLVLAPRGRSWARRALLLEASALIYFGAVWLAVDLAAERHWSEVAACALVGALAAPILALAARPFLALRSRLGDHLLALLAGAAGGAAIGIAAMGGDDRWLSFDLPLLAGFLVWQVGWAAAHIPRLDGAGRAD